jgi:hypothetical protein
MDQKGGKVTRVKSSMHWLLRPSAFSCTVISLALAGLLTACTLRADATKGIRERPQHVMANPDKAPISNPTQKARGFEGQWSYRDDCDHGHYVTLELKRDRDQLIGSWSDGTLLRGSQGLLKGRVSNGRLIAEWCSEYEEAGVLAVCPHYDWLEDYFVARGGTIVWYRKYGQEYSEYVVLTRGNKLHRSTETCDGDK